MIPAGLDFYQTLEERIIRKNWRTWTLVPIFGVTGIWIGSIVSWYETLFSHPNPSLVALLFPICHVLIGLGLSYYAVACLVNWTDIRISSSGIRVVSGPIPWTGNKFIPKDQIIRVLIRERYESGRKRKFEVMYVDSSGEEKLVANFLPERDQAVFLVQTIKDVQNLRTSANLTATS